MKRSSEQSKYDLEKKLKTSHLSVELEEEDLLISGEMTEDVANVLNIESAIPVEKTSNTVRLSVTLKQYDLNCKRFNFFCRTCPSRMFRKRPTKKPFLRRWSIRRSTMKGEFAIYKYIVPVYEFESIEVSFRVAVSTPSSPFR